jgi:uncharacterized protein
MKESRYNLTTKGNDNKYIFYNVRTGAIVRIEDQKYQLVKNILATPDNYLDHSYCKVLEKEGFLIPDTFDELADIKTKSILAKALYNGISFTILNTLACNFKCYYCYETRRHVTMTKETQEKLVEYFVNIVERTGKKRFNVTWLGGEPLLRLDIIENLNKSFKEICTLNGISYSSYIVTNGYYINKLTPNIIKSLNLTGIQVTLDGDKDNHDKRRVLNNGGPTFDRIFQNITTVSQYFGNINIRVNVDKTNVQSASRILDLLAESNLRDKVGLYFSPVTDTTDACKHVAPTCLMEEEFARFQLEVIAMGKEKGFNLLNLPFPRTNFCGAEGTDIYVFDPEGNIFKCWDDVSYPEKSYADIFNNRFPDYGKIGKYILHGPCFNSICAECKLVPICMGGCPNRKKYSGDLVVKTNCISEKHNISEMLQLYSTYKSDDAVKITI